MCKSKQCQTRNTLIAIASAGVTMGVANYAGNRLAAMPSLASVQNYIKPAVSAGIGFLALRKINNVPVKTGVVIGAGVLGAVSAAKMLGLTQFTQYVPVLSGDADDGKVRIPVSSPQEAMQAFAAMYPQAAQQLEDSRRAGIEGALEQRVPTLSGEPENLLTTEYDTLG